MEDYFDKIYNSPLRNLNNVVRYSGTFCIKPENDGYHTIDMMSMCMKLADIIEESSQNIKIDRRDLIYRCYLHDMDESLMGDISRVIKYYNDDIYNSINNVVYDLMKKNFSEDLVEDINSSKDKDNICGLIVKISDTLQSSIKIYEECRLGNFHFNKIIKENVKFVSNLRGIIYSSKLYKDDTFTHAMNELIEVIKQFEDKLSEEISRLKG